MTEQRSCGGPSTYRRALDSIRAYARLGLMAAVVRVSAFPLILPAIGIENQRLQGPELAGSVLPRHLPVDSVLLNKSLPAIPAVA